MKTQYSCHRGSHTISKGKPKIRIIHIVSPEIIKTDAQNFRSLVQKLTGKPLGKSSKKGKNVSSLPKKKVQSTSSQQKTAAHNPNPFLSFMGEGITHGGMNINELPLLQFRPSNSQINTFGRIPFF